MYLNIGLAFNIITYWPCILLFFFSPPTSGGVSRSSHLRGDSEHLALRGHAAAGQLPAGGHASELHQLRLSQRGRGRARRRWAPRARPTNPRQEIQHVRRPAPGTLKPQTAGARWKCFTSTMNIQIWKSHISLLTCFTLTFFTTILALMLLHLTFYSHNLWVIITWSRATASNCRGFLYY